MPKICAICGKKVSYGNKLTRRGMSKSKGGAGRKTTGITPRKFKPNLQRIKAVIGGRTKKIYACTKCIKTGLIQKKA